MKAELSKTSEWWIPRERYFELRHMCRGYHHYINLLNDIYNSTSHVIPDFAKIKKNKGEYRDPVSDKIDRAIYLTKKLDAIVNSSAMVGIIGTSILKCVTEGVGYDKLNAQNPIPCGRRQFYEAYRQYFWILDMYERGYEESQILQYYDSARKKIKVHNRR